MTERSTPLADLRVIDLSSVLAGPSCARYLADFGADVIKVERPDGGDTWRRMGWLDVDGTSLWWKLTNRGKRCVALDLKDPDDRTVLLGLVDRADVVVENFRPGTLERLGLGPDVLLGRNEHLVLVRLTGFGQDGPYASRPGFATIAEAMSGFAAINGTADTGPLLPPIALADEITGLVSAFATMVALHSGVGQVVDVNLLESLFQLMGPLLSVYERTGYLQPPMGSALPYSVPRGTYRCSDGRWIAFSASAESVAARVLGLIGATEERFATFQGRMEHAQELDGRVADWVAARTSDEVLAAFDAAQAACAPVLDMADIVGDPHFAARGTIVELDGVLMQGLVARLSKTPGRLRGPARGLDADGEDIRANGWGQDDPTAAT
jgi:crotonobetainyl-CoA:carnitine CoA-transferase CaiB-like acyl-CoA transferase